MSTKWALLRNALLTKEAEVEHSTAIEASIHRHDGFHMFTKTKGAALGHKLEISYPSTEVNGLAKDMAQVRAEVLAAFSNQGVDSVSIVAATAGAAAIVSAVAAEWGVEVLTETPTAVPREDGVRATIAKAEVARRDGLDASNFTTLGGLRHAGFEVVRYHVPRLSTGGDGHGGDKETLPTSYSAKEDSIVLRVLERRANAKLSFAELAPRSNDVGDASCFNNRVDNTGNVRVWPAEEVLLHLLILAARQHGAVLTPYSYNVASALPIDASSSSSSSNSAELSPSSSSEPYPAALPASFFASGGKRVLELGGGMTALAGFGFAAATQHDSFAPASLPAPPQANSSHDGTPSALVAHVTVTDGNSSSVEAQRAAAALNAPLLGECDVAVQRLFWEEEDASGTEAALRLALRNRGPRAAATTTTGTDSARDNDNKEDKVCVGSTVEAQWQTGRKWHRNAIVKAVHVDGSMAIAYADGDYWAHVPPYKVRWPGNTKPLAPPPYAPNFAAAVKSIAMTTAKNEASSLPPPPPEDGSGEGSNGENSSGSSDELDECLRYDLIVGADLLFFESHAALAKTLDRLLKKQPTAPVLIDGANNKNPFGNSTENSTEITCAATALLVQPSRNGTMERFCAHPDVTSRFAVEVFNGPLLCPRLAEAHARYRSDPAYSPTLHCPQLVRLTRLPVKSAE